MFKVILGALNISASHYLIGIKGICGELGSDQNAWRVNCPEFPLNLSSHFTGLNSSL